MRNKSLSFTSPPGDGILPQKPKQTKINEAAQVRRYVSKWDWPCFNKTLFTKAGEEPHLSWKISVVNSCCIKHLCVYLSVTAPGGGAVGLILQADVLGHSCFLC